MWTASRFQFRISQATDPWSFRWNSIADSPWIGHSECKRDKIYSKRIKWSQDILNRLSDLSNLVMCSFSIANCFPRNPTWVFLSEIGEEVHSLIIGWQTLKNVTETEIAKLFLVFLLVLRFRSLMELLLLCIMWISNSIRMDILRIHEVAAVV